MYYEATAIGLASSRIRDSGTGLEPVVGKLDEPQFGATFLHIIFCWGLLKVLKSDKRAIFTAAGKAQQAVDWLMNQQNQEQAA